VVLEGFLVSFRLSSDFAIVVIVCLSGYQNFTANVMIGLTLAKKIAKNILCKAIEGL
jgi:hypothetical protein